MKLLQMPPSLLLPLATILILLPCAPVNSADPGVGQSATPLLSLPLDCKPNVTCWIGNYMDDGAGGDAVDYACGHRTYKDHNGTDFAILDRKTMLTGVPVIAAAEGIVARLRDGMADIGVSEATRASVAGKDCGNGVVVQHDNGWETQYCHLRHGSVAVHIGERVGVGQQLGLVGLSGLTQFPHVHLTVRRNQQNIDPFIGLTRSRACGLGEHPLWRPELAPALAYEPFAVYHAGFADHVPTPDAVRAGDFDSNTVSAAAPAILFWADVFGTAEGDVMTILIRGPDGTVLTERRHVLKATQALHFEAIGRKRRDRAWPSGRYVGEVTLSRPGTVAGGSRTQRVVREVDIR